MKYIRNNYRRLIILGVIIIVSLIVGGLLFYYSNSNVKEYVYDYLIVNRNLSYSWIYIIIHFSLICSLGVLGFIIIGLPLSAIYYSMEWISIGYLFSLLVFFKKIKGLLFALIYILLFKGIFMLILSYFIICMVSYIKKRINCLTELKNTYLSNYFYRIIFSLFICLINDLILYFIGNNIIKSFIDII